ncbi:unnamed protein product [Dibothriocephalus latus]|uniref:Outer dense fiber protein 3 n=1 Tax=Dibothriocephalus latus TaxID=60516 RepID=A0A3P7LJD7_DIBLA|nr:unnamed protein product [Dibothriocephalus latus]
MVYNYTVPRKPVAASYGNPGPCYTLPSLTGYPKHDPQSVHIREPQWSFGIKHENEVNSGPGPGYYLSSDVSRHGKEAKMPCSMKGQRKDSAKAITPGANAYNTGPSFKANTHKAPVYSFRTKPNDLSRGDFPAPNAYSLDTMIGKTIRSDKSSAPIYSLASRIESESERRLRKNEIPGPGAHKVTDPSVYNAKAPQYTITSRSWPPGDSFNTPGPDAYKREAVYLNKPINPKTSFGIKHSKYQGELISAADLVD